MDKPIGPRPPDKRNTAYEDIFGKPSVIHHLSTAPTIHPQHQGPYYYPRQPLYQNNIDRAVTLHSAQHLQRQSFIPSQSPSQPLAPLPPQVYSASQSQSQSLTPPSIHSRARSDGSSGCSIGVTQPQLADPIDTTFQALTRSGLTPAQAYQAQIYLSSPGGQHSERVQPRRESAPAYSSPATQSTYQPDNGAAVRTGMPRLAIHVDDDDGKVLNPEDSPSEDGSDEGPSELPWARSRAFATPKSPFGKRRSDLDATATLVSAPQQPPPQVVAPRLVSQSTAPAASNRPNTLTLDTGLSPASPSPGVLSTSPSSSASTTLVHTSSSSYSARRSSDSSRTMPRPPNGTRRERTMADRSMSMSAATAGARTALLGFSGHSRPPLPGMVGSGRTSPTALRFAHARSRMPVVYPALLSRVAAAFRERIQLSDHVKDGLTYTDCFDGREAVDKITYIIKTADRNLALLLGRALDAQKFFHDVTYDHRLRDSPSELYQFPMGVASPFVSGELANGPAKDGQEMPPKPPSKHDSSADSSVRISSAPSARDRSAEWSRSPTSDATTTPSTTPSPAPPSPKDEPDSEHTRQRSSELMTSDDVPLPSGVFTLLTDCYSPTCSRDQLCYSIACPRRLEQQARLNMKLQPGLKKQISRESLGDLVEPGTLWIHSVPQEIVNSVSDMEKNRQEAINEVIYTERDFVRDMEYLRDCWIVPLQEQDIILPIERRYDFLSQVFWNMHDIIAVNTRLRDALNKRQKSYVVVEKLGDILLDAVPHFGPFVSYGAHQLYGKFQFEDEKRQNPAFAAFVETTERRPESRKLELNGYLTKPTTRLARYPLLLEAVLKHTPDDNPDKEMLPKVIAIVREFLDRVNTETGKAENRFNLLQLDQQLVFRPGEKVDLRLKEEGRELIYKGSLTKRGGQGEDLQVYLFDHALVMVKQKSKHDQFKVIRRPIPLELLQISAIDEFAPGTARSQGPKYQKSFRRNSLEKHKSTGPILVPSIKNEHRGGFSIHFAHLGRKAYQITLWANTYVSQRKWVENIQKQQEVMRERSDIFESVTVSEGFFIGGNKANCAAPFNRARSVVYGTDDGVYLSDLRDPTRDPVKVLDLLDVSQVDVLEEYQLLIVLSERQVITFPLDALDRNDPTAGLKRAKRISNHTTFFKAGVCLGKTLVCVVKSSPLSSTIKTLEPIDQNIRGRAKPTFRKLLQGGNDTLKLFREFYIPVESSSVHFLKTKLCVGCSRGFEIVDLENLDTQGLLDPSDDSLEFVQRKDNLRPMAIYRIDNEFLLCYDEFAFYVNKNGWRSRKEFMVHWEGSPTGFALHFPYVLAFEPTFVEIRHVETGLMSQVIQGTNLRLLFADTPPSTTNTSSHLQNHHHAGYGHNLYYAPGHADSSSHGNGSAGNGYPTPLVGPVNHHYARGSAAGRDEILMVSDERVVTLRMSARHQQLHASESPL